MPAMQQQVRVDDMVPGGSRGQFAASSARPARSRTLHLSRSARSQGVVSARQAHQWRDASARYRGAALLHYVCVLEHDTAHTWRRRQLRWTSLVRIHRDVLSGLAAGGFVCLQGWTRTTHANDSTRWEVKGDQSCQQLCRDTTRVARGAGASAGQRLVTRCARYEAGGFACGRLNAPAPR